MKKIVFIIAFFIVHLSFSQINSTKIDNISFFDGSSFMLEYFLVNDEQENLVLNHPTGSGFFPAPNLDFMPYTTTNQLEADMGAFCNGGNALYEYTDTYLKFISGARTLAGECSVALDQENRFFNIVQASTDNGTSPEIFYEITSDQMGFWLWINENEKLFFTKATLGVEDINLNKLVEIFPNPASNFLSVKVTEVIVSKISIFDIQGKEVLSKTNDFSNINIAHLSKGLYFIKLKTNLSTVTKKIILK